ncbi:helix-turn-helix domain-containing protein, partial (plasmid) [Escherichia coli]
LGYDVLYWVYCTHPNECVKLRYVQMSTKERLREVMDANGMTIKALSDFIKRDSISAHFKTICVERENQTPEALVALSTHLGVSIDWLPTGKRAYSI